MITFGEVAKRGRGWLPLIGLNALIGSGVTLALPTVLGHSVDAIVAGTGYTRWLMVAAALIGLGIAASIVDAFAGAACVACGPRRPRRYTRLRDR
jgi:ATP-binding cassette, subfamily B, bacterial